MASIVKFALLTNAIQQVLRNNPNNEANDSYVRFVLPSEVVERLAREGKFKSTSLEALKKHPRESLKSATQEHGATQCQGSFYILYDHGAFTAAQTGWTAVGGTVAASILSASGQTLSNAAMGGFLIASGVLTAAWSLEEVFKWPLDKHEE